MDIYPLKKLVKLLLVFCCLIGTVSADGMETGPSNGIDASWNGYAEVYFNATNTTPVDSWNWSFGDGTFADTQNTTHLLPYGQVNHITLTITNGTDSRSITKTISLIPSGSDSTFNDSAILIMVFGVVLVALFMRKKGGEGGN